VPQPVNVAEFAFSVKDLLRPFTRKAKRLGEGAKQLDNLCNMVVVLAVLGTGLRIEEIVSGDEFESLPGQLSVWTRGDWIPDFQPTMAAMLQTSVLAPHLDPRITSGERYCLVWISLVK
jgi:hypothetical protein